MDLDMSVILKSYPGDDNSCEILICGRTPCIMRMGKVYLERLINTSVITIITDPIYDDAINFITALAIHVSNELRRGPHSASLSHSPSSSDASASENSAEPELKPMPLECWRNMGSARIIFHGIKLNGTVLDGHVCYLEQTILTENDLPNSFNSFLKRSGKTDRAHRLPIGCCRRCSTWQG